jgi:hypothetical protein
VPTELDKIERSEHELRESLTGVVITLGLYTGFQALTGHL